MKISKTVKRTGCVLAQPTQAQQNLRSVANASEQLGISLMSVRRLIADNQLQSVRILGRVLIPQSAIDALVLRGTR
jgi:excisionase family DNA binding protein